MVTSAEAEVFSAFVQLERWRAISNVSIVLTVDPNTEMRREHGGQLISRMGSLMNPAALEEFNAVQEEVLGRYQHEFNLWQLVADRPAREVALAMLTERILPGLDAIADPSVLAVPSAALWRGMGALLDGSPSSISAARAVELLASLEPQLETHKRSTVEEDRTKVQLVACGIFEFDGKYLVLERRKGDTKNDEYGRHTLWKGCHLTPVAEARPLVQHMKQALLSRIQEDLHLASDAVTVQLTSASWIPPATHLGVIFQVHMPNAEVANAMVKKYRRSGREEPVLRGELESRDDILRKHQGGQIQLEPWSLSWLKEVAR